MRYPLVFYTEFGIPATAAGCARGPIIFIRPKYKDDEGLYQHELVHVKQWVFSLGIHSLLYMVFDWYRMHMEADAYREQLKYYPDDRTEMFAEFLTQNYKLNITKDLAIKLLQHGD